MKKHYTFLVVLFLLTMIGLSYIISSNGGKNSDFVRALDETPEKFERNIITNPIKTTFLTDTTSIFRPAQVRNFKNKVYINDFADFTIYEYDIEGNQKRKLTTSRGRGPGEIQHLTDFDVKDDKIWIADSRNLRVTSYSLETGEYVDSHTLESRPMRVTVLEDGFVVLWLGADKLFSKFDLEGNEIHHFGEIIEDQQMHQLSMDGTIRSNKKDRFVYIPFYASLIYHFTGDGELINILKAPDGLQFPAALRDGPTTFAPDFSYMRDGFIDNKNNLYVYSRVPDEESAHDKATPISFVDKYSLVDAVYRESIILNHHYSNLMYYPESRSVFASDMEKSFIHQLENPF